MVTIDSFISIDPIGRTRTVKCECDLCGKPCNQGGCKEERLYQYDDDQLCFDCMWDAMFTAGVFEVVDVE